VKLLNSPTKAGGSRGGLKGAQGELEGAEGDFSDKSTNYK